MARLVGLIMEKELLESGIYAETAYEYDLRGREVVPCRNPYENYLTLLLLGAILRLTG